MGTKASTPSSTTTSTTPWSGVQPYITSSLQSAQDLYNSGAGYYPESTVAPLSGQSQQAIDLTTSRALNGSPVQTAAQNNATATLNGDFLNSNPHLQGAIDAASQGTIRNFQNSVMPGIEAGFSKAGRYGSGAQQASVSDAQSNLASQLGNISSSMAYQNYGDERSRQTQASALAPQLAGMDFTNLTALANAGATVDGQNQAQLTDLVNRYNYANGGSLDDFIARINGTGATNYQNSTQATTTKKNQLAGALGGAMSGASMGAMFGPWGALAGGALGGVGGLF